MANLTPAAGAIGDVVRVEGGDIEFGDGVESPEATGELGLQSEQVGGGGGLLHPWCPGGLTRQGIAVGATVDRPLNQRLGLNHQFGLVADAQRDVITDVVTVAIGLVAGQHPAVIDLLLFFDRGGAADRDRQSFLDAQVVPLGFDHRVAIGLKCGHHVFRVQPGLGWGEGIVGEADPVAAEGGGGERQMAGLQAPAGDRAPQQGLVVLGGEIVELHRSHPAELIDGVGARGIGGEAAATFGDQALLELHIADALIEPGNRVAAGLFLGAGAGPDIAGGAGNGALRWPRRRLSGDPPLTQGHLFQLLLEGEGCFLLLRRHRSGAALGWWQGNRLAGWSRGAEAVAQADEIGIAALTHAVVDPIGPGAVVNASHR